MISSIGHTISSIGHMISSIGHMIIGLIFQSGVYSATGCSSINHAMDIVGYGVEGGQNFWKVRNRYCEDYYSY